MADQDEEDKKQQQPAVVINTAPPAANYGGLYNAAFNHPSSNIQGPTQPVPQEQSANQANPQDLNALQQRLAGQQQAQQQMVPDKNINLGLNQQGQGGVQNAGYNDSQNDYMKQMQQTAQAQVDAIKAQGEAARASAAVMGRQGLEESQQYQESAQKANDLTTDFNQRYKSHQEELQNALKDYNDGHINPNQLHENMSVPQKITTAIGMLIAGAGAGLLHQENPVMRWMNQQIDRDIDAQKHNINSAYSHYRDQMQDDQHAEQMTKALLQQNYANQIRATAAKYAGPLAQQQAAGVAAQFDGQAQNVLGQLAMGQAQMRAQQGLMGQTNMAPEQQLHAMAQMNMIPKDEVGKIATELGQAQNATAAGSNILAAFDKASQENTVLRTGAGLLRTPPSIKTMRALYLPVIHDQEGRVSEFEQKTLEDLEPKPGDSEDTVRAKRHGLEQFLVSKTAAPHAQTYGIRVPKPSSFTKYGQ